jgi:hypothetical protein
MALYKAKKAVKHQLQAQGLKLTHYSAKDIIILAEQYMAQSSWPNNTWPSI